MDLSLCVSEKWVLKRLTSADDYFNLRIHEYQSPRFRGLISNGIVSRNSIKFRHRVTQRITSCHSTIQKYLSHPAACTGWRVRGFTAPLPCWESLPFSTFKRCGLRLSVLIFEFIGIAHDPLIMPFHGLEQWPARD